MVQTHLHAHINDGLSNPLPLTWVVSRKSLCCAQIQESEWQIDFIHLPITNNNSIQNEHQTEELLIILYYISDEISEVLLCKMREESTSGHHTQTTLSQTIIPPIYSSKGPFIFPKSHLISPKRPTCLLPFPYEFGM